ncbi:hypothetical protein [Dactylosporangium cerinum]
MGSPYQALQLAEMGLDELPDDVELLACGARAAWLAGLLDDAQELGRRWLAAAGTRGERADALRLLVRLSWEIGSSGSMQERAAELRAEIEPLDDGPAKAHAYAAIAQAYMLHDDTERAIEWADKAITLGEELGLPGVWLAGKVEKGSALVNFAAGVDDGIKLLNEAAQEAEQEGSGCSRRGRSTTCTTCCPVARRTGPRRWSGCGRSRSGPGSSPSPSPPTSRDGPGSPCRRATSVERSPSSSRPVGATGACCAPATASTTTACSSPGCSWKPASSTGPTRSSAAWRRRPTPTRC